MGNKSPLFQPTFSLRLKCHWPWIYQSFSVLDDDIPGIHSGQYWSNHETNQNVSNSSVSPRGAP